MGARHLRFAHRVTVGPKEMLWTHEGAQRINAVGGRCARDVTHHVDTEWLREWNQGIARFLALDVNCGAVRLPLVRAVGWEIRDCEATQARDQRILFAWPGPSQVFVAIPEVCAEMHRDEAASNITNRVLILMNHLPGWAFDTPDLSWLLLLPERRAVCRVTETLVVHKRVDSVVLSTLAWTIEAVGVAAKFRLRQAECVFLPRAVGVALVATEVAVAANA
jgi:hypothetical protein